MARVPYIKPGSGDERIEAAYKEVVALGRPVAHLYQALANQPPALDAFLGMSRYVRNASSLPPALRELAILVTAHELNQDYERAHHLPVARQAQVAESVLAAVERNGWSELPNQTKLVLDYARQVARNRSVDEATFAALSRELSVPMLVDLVVTVAWYHLCAAILGPLEIEIEDEMRPR